MTLLRDTLTGIVQAFNRTHALRLVTHTVSDREGRASIDLSDVLPEGASDVLVSSLATDREQVDPRWHLDGRVVRLQLYSRGVHYLPTRWDALAQPVEVSLVAGYLPPALDVPNLDLDGLEHFGIDLPAALEHEVAHGMGRTRFIERITDAEGRAQFASVEAIDADHVRVTLAEAIAVRLDMIFMPAEDADNGVQA